MSKSKIIQFTTPSKQALTFWDDQPPLLPVNDPYDFVFERQEMAEMFSAGSEAAAQKYCREVTVQQMANSRYLRIEPKTLNNSGKIGIFLFGGGFISGSPEIDLRLSAPLASELGIVLLSPDYRLAPEHPFPAALDDCVAFYAAVIAEYGADNVVLIGESAGANLALTTVLKAKEDGLPLPKAVALLSPITDQSSDAYDAKNIYPDDPSLDASRIKRVQDVYAPQMPINNPLVSPHFAAYGAWCPPLLFTTGTRDIFQHQVINSAEKIAASHVDVTVHIYEGMWHVFEYYPELPEAMQSIKRIAEFLQSHL